MERKGKASVKKGGREITLRDARELRKEIGMKNTLHGPMDYAKTLKLHFL